MISTVNFNCKKRSCLQNFGWKIFSPLSISIERPNVIQPFFNKISFRILHKMPRLRWGERRVMNFRMFDYLESYEIWIIYVSLSHLLKSITPHCIWKCITRFFMSTSHLGPGIILYCYVSPSHTITIVYDSLQQSVPCYHFVQHLTFSLFCLIFLVLFNLCSV